MTEKVYHAGMVYTKGVRLGREQSYDRSQLYNKFGIKNVVCLYVCEAVGVGSLKVLFHY